MDADASPLRMELMHGAEKQGVIHHFLSIFVRTPTVPGLSRAVAARVGVDLPARPYFTVTPRQHGHSLLTFASDIYIITTVNYQR